MPGYTTLISSCSVTVSFPAPGRRSSPPVEQQKVGKSGRKQRRPSTVQPSTTSHHRPHNPSSDPRHSLPFYFKHASVFCA
ncbi:hypothetical protein CC79DRAFT_783708 [Sarocladium strictum]